jgi:hypothetical protein
MGLDEKSNEVKFYTKPCSNKSKIVIDGKEFHNVKNFSITSVPMSNRAEVSITFVSENVGEYEYKENEYSSVEDALNEEYKRILDCILGSEKYTTIWTKKVDRNNIRDLVVAAYYFGFGEKFYKDWKE